MAGSTFVDINAAADFMGPGAIEVPRYQSEILDMVRRRGVLGQRTTGGQVPATGQPHRYFEQTRIVAGQFQDPRQLQHAPGVDPTRRERAAALKALVGSIGFGLFDVEVNRQQGQFTQLVAKDLEDTLSGLLRTADLAMWNGADTDLVSPTSLEYMGGLRQINRTASVASSASIIDSVKAEIASMMADTNFEVRPTALYGNPVLLDLIDQEERQNHRQIPTTILNNVTGGLVCNAIATQAGLLPLIADWTLLNGPTGGSVLEAGKTDYYLVILTESMVERPYITSATPRVFTLGLEGNLNTRFSLVQFDTIIFRGKANASQTQNQVETSAVSYPHSVMTVTR